MLFELRQDQCFIPYYIFFIFSSQKNCLELLDWKPDICSFKYYISLKTNVTFSDVTFLSKQTIMSCFVINCTFWTNVWRGVWVENFSLILFLLQIKRHTVSFRDLDRRWQDDYFWVDFDHFWRELHFLGQLGQYQKLARA